MPGYLTPDMVRQISREGHSIGCHSHTHKRLDHMTEPEVREQLETSRRMIRELVGSLPVFFAPPGGFINTLVRNLALEYGMPVIRTMKWGYNLRRELADLECVPLHRHQTEEEFTRLLRARRRSPLYAAKETAKKLVPARAYEALREAFFSLRHRG
jgi:peptidoglycan/xylan/chitin deacetylase (PgdA/CDA1 family)